MSSELCTRASDANGNNKGAALVKTRDIHACVEGRYSPRLGKPDFYVWRTCSWGETGGGGGASSPATGKSCLSIHTCVQGRPSKTWNCSRSGITIVSPMASSSSTVYLCISSYIAVKIIWIYDLFMEKRFKVLDLLIIEFL